jgi:hypothetical protein
MQKQKVQEVKEVFSFYRGLILDLFEQELGDAKNWQFIRSRLLKVLSPERGLEAKVVEILLDGRNDERIL